MNKYTEFNPREFKGKNDFWDFLVQMNFRKAVQGVRAFRDRDSSTKDILLGNKMTGIRKGLVYPILDVF